MNSTLDLPKVGDIIYVSKKAHPTKIGFAYSTEYWPQYDKAIVEKISFKIKNAFYCRTESNRTCLAVNH